MTCTPGTSDRHGRLQCGLGLLPNSEGQTVLLCLYPVQVPSLWFWGGLLPGGGLPVSQPQTHPDLCLAKGFPSSVQ